MTTLLTIAGITAYLIIGSMVGKVLLDHARRNCSRWIAMQKAQQKGRLHELDSYERCENEDHMMPFFTGAFWPLAIPVFVGVAVGSWTTGREARMERREKRREAGHARRMEELEAQRKMTMESVKFLVENGIKADVPGLFEDRP